MENKYFSIELTNFSLRHFAKSFGGTKILDMNPEEFMKAIKSSVLLKVIDGYAPFCKLLFFPNFTDARVGTLKINLENYQYLRSGYSSRTKDELPVLSRWFELPLPAPHANYLVLVVYSRDQLEKEHGDDTPFIMHSEWGVVAILGQLYDEEEPMSPMTMIRNALGVKEGGSGVKLDREAYNKSVEFWREHAIVK